MNYLVLHEERDVADAITRQIEDVIRAKENALICLCAGHSPIGVMQRLADDALAGVYNADSFKFISLDEWVGLGKEDSGSCIHDVSKYFLSPLKIERGERMFFFNGQSTDLQGECQSAKDFIKACGGIDLLLLGIGMNGHIGFNEPGTEKDSSVRVLPLSETSKTVGVKYFDKPYDLEYGITIGLREILGAKKILVMAVGEHKAEIVSKVINGEETTDIPASLIKGHSDITFVLDTGAAHLI